MTHPLWPSRILVSFLLLAPTVVAAADKESPTTRIEAAGGAGARTITGGTFNIYNYDPEELKRLADRLDRSEGDRRAAESKAAELARQLNLRDVTTQTVVGFLRVLARQHDLKLEQVPDKMAEITASYLQMQERLADLAPQDREAADLTQKAAKVSKAGRFEEADRLLREAEARETAAIDEHRRKAAQIRAARGDNAETRLQHAEAANHYEAAVEMLPSDAAATRGFYLVEAGDLRLISGSLASALTNFQSAYAALENLSKADPGNAEWQRGLTVPHERIGDVLVAEGDREGALKSYSAGLAIRENLARRDPGNTEWQRDLSVSHERIGDVLVAEGDREGALATYRAGLAIRETLARRDPGNTLWQRDLIVSCVKLAEADPNAAPAPLKRARDIAMQLQSSGKLAPVDAWMPDDLARRLAERTGK